MLRYFTVYPSRRSRATVLFATRTTGRIRLYLNHGASTKPGAIQSAYEFSGVDAVHMALSKKSPLGKRKAEFDRINDELIQEGFIKQVVERYYSKYQP